uniref:Uncharacterized protein n=1 Tax=Tanacetum cinerariifolium TaxID=118510 RepID=A0A699LC10_TANCI|nr:hypothetical protein [Tanacetum cinerariifolium]
MSVPRRNCGFGNVFFAYSQLMIARAKIYFQKISRLLQLIEQDVDLRKTVAVLDSLYTCKTSHPSILRTTPVLLKVKNWVIWNLCLGALYTGWTILAFL